jgi:hypothetical protein
MIRTVQGWGDIYRFANNLTHDQVEFAEAGRHIIDKLKRRLGKERYRQLIDYWHGPEQATKVEREPAARQAKP